MAAAELLKIMHSVDNKVMGVDKRVQGVNNNVEDVSNRVQGIDNKVQGVDDKVQDIDDNVQDVRDKVQGINDAAQGIDDGVQYVRYRLQGVDEKVDHINRSSFLSLPLPLLIPRISQETSYEIAFCVGFPLQIHPQITILPLTLIILEQHSGSFKAVSSTNGSPLVPFYGSVENVCSS